MQIARAVRALEVACSMKAWLILLRPNYHKRIVWSNPQHSIGWMRVENRYVSNEHDNQSLAEQFSRLAFVENRWIRSRIMC